MNLKECFWLFQVGWFLVENLARPKVFWSVSSFDFQLAVITMLEKKNVGRQVAKGLTQLRCKWHLVRHVVFFIMKVCL